MTNSQNTLIYFILKFILKYTELYDMRDKYQISKIKVSQEREFIRPAEEPQLVSRKKWNNVLTKRRVSSGITKRMEARRG